MDCRGRAGNSADDLDREGRLSRSGLRAQQSRHPGQLEPPGLLVSQRVRAPAELRDREATLDFKGINYAAEVWLNGIRVGGIRGAFIRGIFDVTGCCDRGAPMRWPCASHRRRIPGIPHEQSIAAGPGENGGMLALDGPTFIATEGWDWIPGIRDRDTGHLAGRRAAGHRWLAAARSSGRHAPAAAAHRQADIAIAVPIENRARDAGSRDADRPASAAISVRKNLDASTRPNERRAGSGASSRSCASQRRACGGRTATGAANLYTLISQIDEGAASRIPRRSNSASARSPTSCRCSTHEGDCAASRSIRRWAPLLGERLVDVRHEAIKRTPRGLGGEPDGGRREARRRFSRRARVPDARILVIRVNGVPIAARGGSWGMDDRASGSRARAWSRISGCIARRTSTSSATGSARTPRSVFYDLADEYGLLVLNDFWESTQDFQLEPQDPALFLANARDVISRYRNHPSIALWFGRNEGVPQPISTRGSRIWWRRSTARAITPAARTR